MRTAVITGGAGGLGRALAEGLARRGWHSVILDRDLAGMEETPTRSLIQVDLTDPGALRDAATHIRSRWPGVGLVIYNAGLTQIGSLADTPLEAHRKVMEVNHFSALALAREMQGLLRANRGSHLAISSVAGFAPLHHRVAYAASKHALEGAFASLRSEERPHGVGVQIAAPSFIATNPGADFAGDGVGRPGAAADGVDEMSPDRAAEVILRGWQRRRDFIPVGRVAWLSWLLFRLSPGLYQRVMERRIDGGQA